MRGRVLDLLRIFVVQADADTLGVVRSALNCVRTMVKHIMAMPHDVNECIGKAAGSVILKMAYGYDAREDHGEIVDLVNQVATE